MTPSFFLHAVAGSLAIALIAIHLHLGLLVLVCMSVIYACLLGAATFRE